MNKTFRLYGILFIIVMMVLVLLELNKKEVTDWRKNFDVLEKTPFGLFVFNQESKTLLNNQLEKSSLSPYEYYKEGTKNPHNILLIESAIDEESWKKILQNVENGSDALIISSKFHKKIQDSLNFYSGYTSFGDRNSLFLTDKKFKKDSIFLDKLPSGQGFTSVSKKFEILGQSKETGERLQINFIRLKHGKGNLFLHSEPLIVTNYYLLNPKNTKYNEHVFSYLPKRQTVWFSGENQIKVVSQSPMRFILSNPALKYAWWLLLGGLLLFVIFNAKRKQRIVPIIEPLQNKSVDFVKSIGNLYLQEGDFHDMMAKKSQYFLHRVRLDLMIETQQLDDLFIKKLHHKTGKSEAMIREAVLLMKKGQDPYASVIKDDLVKLNQLLREILP